VADMALNPWKRLLQPLLILLLGSSSIACKPSHMLPGQPVTPLNLDESNSQLSKAETRPSEDNGGLPGYPLICQIEDRKIDSAALDCQIIASNGSTLNLAEEFSEWQFDFLTSFPDLSVKQRAKTEPWHVSWQVHYPSHGDLHLALDQSVIRFKAKSRNSDTTSRDFLWKITESLPLKWESRHAQRFRLVIHSIDTTAFSDPAACISFLQFSVNREWLVASYDHATDNLQLGKYPSTVMASSNPHHLLEAFFPEGFWESEYATYNQFSPHDATVSGATWIEINFGDSLIAINGVRILGTPADHYSPGECSPDLISLLQSKDGLNWQEIPAISWLNINSISLFEKTW